MTTARTFLESARLFNARKGQCLAILFFRDGSFMASGRKMEIGG